MIFVNHQEVVTGIHLIRNYTLVSFLYCDALEIFIYISGYVSGIVYGKTLRRHGYVACQKKSLHRCVRLYASNLILFLIVLAIATTMNVDASTQHTMRVSQLNALHEQPLESTIRFLALQYSPLSLDLLHLYVVLLAMAPVFLMIGSCDVLLAFIASYAIYSTMQFLAFTGHVTSTTEISVFSWQLLYNTGLLIGAYQPKFLKSLLESRKVFCFCLLGLALITFIRVCCPIAMLNARFGHGDFWRHVSEVLPFTSKQFLHPIRLLNFFFLAHVALFCCPKSRQLESWPPTRILIQCGQHSLPVFCLGVLLNYLGALVILPTWFSRILPPTLGLWLYEMLGILLTIAFASMLALSRSKSLKNANTVDLVAPNVDEQSHQQASQPTSRVSDSTTANLDIP